jgi:hypothetical protein
MEEKMGKLVFTILLAGAGLLVPPAPASLPFLVQVRPATGDRVVLRVDRGDSLHVLASAVGLSIDGRRFTEFVAPGTLEITGGEGELELRSADPGVAFVLSFKRETAGVSREFEARGERAVIRVRGGDVTVAAESMTMRAARAP